MSDESRDQPEEGAASLTESTPPDGERRSSRPPPPRRSSIPPAPDESPLMAPSAPPRPAVRRSSIPPSDPDRPVSIRTPIPPRPEELAKFSEPAERATPTTPVPAAPVVPVAPGISSIPAAIPSAPSPIAPSQRPEAPSAPPASSSESPSQRSHFVAPDDEAPGASTISEPVPAFSQPVSPEIEGTVVEEVEEIDIQLPTDDDIVEPIRAMRVIKLNQAKRDSVTPPPAAPVIEAQETSYEDLEAGLDGDQIAALTPSAPPPVEPPGVDVDVDEEPPDSAEVFDDPIEEVTLEVQPAPPPLQRGAQPEIPPADRPPPPPRRSAKPSLPTVKKPRKKPWWETLFGDDFSRAYRPMTQTQLRREVDFILDQLQVPRGAVILDLGCGQGEICVELSRRGYSVVGYDLSVFQLAMAGDNAQQAKQKINFLQGDMREMAFDQMFDAVICWDTTFGYFEEDKNLDVLRRIKNALKPSGRLLLDVMNRDFAASEAPMNHWFEGDGCVCMDDMSLDWITNRLKVKRSIILDDGRSKELQYSTRLYTLSEVGRMLHDVGFRVAAVSGDVATKGAFFGPASRRIIIQAGKP